MQLHYTNCTTLQLQLTTTTPLHHNYNILQLHLQHYKYNYNCTTPHYIQQLWWGDHCNHCNHSRKHNSNHLSVHQWIRSAIRESQQLTLPIGFLFLKLPPPTVLLVSSLITTLIYGFYTVCIYNIYMYDICICERTQNHGRRKASVQTMNFGIKWHEGVKNGWSPSGHRTIVKPCSNLFQAETLDLVLLWGAASPNLMEAALDLGMQMHEGRSTRSAQDTEVSVSNGKSTDFRASKVLQPKNWMAHSWFTSKITNEISRSTAKSPSGSQPAKSPKFPQHVNLIIAKQSLKCCLILKTS